MFIDVDSCLNNLACLENLSKVGGELRICGNSNLRDLSCLRNVTHIGGCLRIEGNAALTSLAGLEKLSYLGGNLVIANNAIPHEEIERIRARLAGRGWTGVLITD